MQKEKSPIMETFRKHLCGYVNMWFQLQEPRKHLDIVEKQEPKARGTEFHYNTHLLQSLIESLKSSWVENRKMRWCILHISAHLTGLYYPKIGLCFPASPNCPSWPPWNLPTWQGPAQCHLTHHLHRLQLNSSSPVLNFYRTYLL